MENIYNWFKDAKCGLIIHFGLYSLLGGEYKTYKMNSYCEWIQSYARIKNSEYFKLVEKFNPIYFDAEEIVKFAKNNGFKYIIFTAKHHDGFCMFHSKYDDWNISKTPYKKDIVKQLSDMCKKYGIKFGIYYSQDLDWHEPNGGGYNCDNSDCAGTSWCNDWDFTNKDKNFDLYFNNKVLFQVEELCKNYGTIDLFWFDTPKTINLEQSKQLYNLVKLLQPNCLINSRLGNGSYDYVTLGDNEIPDKITDITSKDFNDINGIKYSKNSLYESVCTLNNTWGYSKFDNSYKTIQQIRSIKDKLNKLGVCYTINLSPDPTGKIPTESLEILSKLDN